MTSTDLVGGFGTRDGTLDFYLRIRSLVKPEMTVLDLGAGRGGWHEEHGDKFVSKVRKLKGHVKRVIAADVDLAVKENTSCDQYVLMKDGQIPLPDSSIDIVVSDFVLEHVSDPAKFSAEVARVLKSGGWFCARTPHQFNYVVLIARITSARVGDFVLSFAQPGRKPEDVFPKEYRMNSIERIGSCFPGWENRSFVYRSDPAYFFGSRVVYLVMDFVHRMMPAFFSGTLMVFLQKNDDLRMKR